MPFVAQAIWTGQFRRAALLVFVAGWTDALDGFLARRFAWTSRTGAYLDPIADKLLLISAYVALAMQGAAPVWLMWLVLGRDALILGMVAIAFAFTTVRSFPPSLWGKLSTIAQVFTALALIVLRAFVGSRQAGFEAFIIYATAAITALSGLHYIVTGARRFQAARRAD